MGVALRVGLSSLRNDRLRKSNSPKVLFKELKIEFRY